MAPYHPFVKQPVKSKIKTKIAQVKKAPAQVKKAPTRPLNGFIAFRQYYSPMFIVLPGSQQKFISPLIRYMWQFEPAKGAWAVLAKAWSIIRDLQGKSNSPLEPFIQMNAVTFDIPIREAYLSNMGFGIMLDSDSVPALHQVAEFSRREIEVTNSASSIEEILSTCVSAGYVSSAVLAKVPQNILIVKPQQTNRTSPEIEVNFPPITKIINELELSQPSSTSAAFNELVVDEPVSEGCASEVTMSEPEINSFAEAGYTQIEDAGMSNSDLVKEQGNGPFSETIHVIPGAKSWNFADVFDFDDNFTTFSPSGNVDAQSPWAGIDKFFPLGPATHHASSPATLSTAQPATNNTAPSSGPAPVAAQSNNHPAGSDLDTDSPFSIVPWMRSASDPWDIGNIAYDTPEDFLL